MPAEITQIIIIFVVVLLTSVLTVVGIEVFLILKEFRITVKKMNKIIDDAGIISESVAKPVQSLSGFLMGLKNGMDFMKIVSKFAEDKEEKKHG